MTLDEIRKVLEEKCLASTDGTMYSFNNVEIVFKTTHATTVMLNTQKIIIEKYSWSNNDGNLLFYHGNKWKYNISSCNIESILYLEDDKIKIEEPHKETKEEISNKFYDKIIKPLIGKIIKDITQTIKEEIKNDKS